jgi:predicted DCC family thiol-disulfide oxidoreductase YuxK
MRRDRPVLIYDGDCSFCTLCVQWMERHLPFQPDIVAWQFADLTAFGVTEAEAAHSVQWVEPAGRVSSGATAVARLLVACGGLWAALGRLVLVPPVSWVAAGIYRLVADNRGRLPGGTAACALPPDQRPGSARRRD